MKKFSYYQCDKVNEKINNFEQVLNRYNTNKNNIGIQEKYDNYKNKYIHVLPTVKRDSLNSMKQNISQPARFYENQIYKEKQNIQQAKKKKQQYMQAYQTQNLSKMFKKDDNNKKMRNTDNVQIKNFIRQNNNLRALKQSNSQILKLNNSLVLKQNNSQKMKQKNNLQRQSISQRDLMKPQYKQQRLKQLKLQMQVMYKHQQQKYSQQTYKQKYQSINILNNQINSIMSKYDYQKITYNHNYYSQLSPIQQIRSNNKQKYEELKIKNNERVKFADYIDENDEFNQQKIQYQKYSQLNDKIKKNQQISINQLSRQSPQQSIVRQKIALKNNQKNNFNDIFHKIDIKNYKSQNYSQLKQNKNKSFSTLKYFKTFKQKQNNQKNKSEQKQNQIDRSIQKLNNKIKQNQEKKKLLNLPFKPFEIHKVTKNKQDKYSQKSQRYFYHNHDKRMRQIIKENNYSSIKQSNHYQIKQNNQNQIKQHNQNQIKQSNHYQIKQYNQNQIKLNNQNQMKPKGIRKNIKQKQQQMKQYKKQQIKQQNLQKIKQQKQSNLQQLLHHKDNRDIQIIQNKQICSQHPKTSKQKKLNKSIILHKKVQRSKNELQKLLINLNKQIQLDKKFRQIKISLHKWINQKDNNLNNQSNQKWIQLTQKLNNYRQNQRKLTIQQTKTIFSININQHDPFSYNKNAQKYFQFDKLFTIYQNTQQFWNQNIQNAFNTEELVKNGFIKQNIDVQNKGFITIQDLVRFVNISLNTMFRNRDFILIFQRFIGKIVKENQINIKKITYQQIIQKLSKCK